MIPALLITVILFLQPASGAIFEIELWPEEGRPVFEAVAPQLRLHALPSESSKIVETLTVRPKQRLSFDDTWYRTTKVGRFLALKLTNVTGRRLGAISRLSRSDYYSGKFGPVTVEVATGDRIEYLQYRAEGTCFVRIAGAVIDADPCPTQQEGAFRLEAKPATEWWIHIIVDDEARGWLPVTDATAKVVDRQG